MLGSRSGEDQVPLIYTKSSNCRPKFPYILGVIVSHFANSSEVITQNLEDHIRLKS